MGLRPEIERTKSRCILSIGYEGTELVVLGALGVGDGEGRGGRVRRWHSDVVCRRVGFVRCVGYVGCGRCGGRVGHVRDVGCFINLNAERHNVELLCRLCLLQLVLRRRSSGWRVSSREGEVG